MIPKCGLEKLALTVNVEEKRSRQKRVSFLSRLKKLYGVKKQELKIRVVIERERDTSLLSGSTAVFLQGESETRME